jgi:hypothetical protein
MLLAIYTPCFVALCSIVQAALYSSLLIHPATRMVFSFEGRQLHIATSCRNYSTTSGSAAAMAFRNEDRALDTLPAIRFVTGARMLII